MNEIVDGRDDKDVETCILVCEAWVDGILCEKPARWMAEWSGRKVLICDEHRSEVYAWYDGDHACDQTGIRWTKLVYHDDMLGWELQHHEMYRVATEYYLVLQEGKDADPQKKDMLKRKLDELSAPFSDCPAYHAFLAMERAAAGM